MLIFYGAVLQKNRHMATIQEIVFNAAETKFSVFSNYISGLRSSPDQLYLDIKFEDIQILNYIRESALFRGFISDEEQEVTIKAKLSIGKNQYKVKLSPTGRNTDMIGNITEDGVKYNLDKLKKEGKIKRIGPDKGGSWEVVK